MAGLLVLAMAACQPAPAGLDTTATYVIANVLATRTAQAANELAQATSPAENRSMEEFTATPLATPVLEAELLFFDDFSDPNSGWEVESKDIGEQGYTGGGYHIHVDKVEYCYWSPIYRTYSDVTIEVDTRMIGGSVNNEFGVLCRLNEDNNFYYFGISSDGYYGIGKMVDDKWIDLGEGGWKLNDKVIKTGMADNHLKASCNYESLSLEVNGSVLADISDAELRSGDLGLYACSYEKDGADILFDNFRVTKP